MKRIEAISHVIKELKLIKGGLMSGKSTEPLAFLKLSEVFKFNIYPKSDRFVATRLDEASQTNDTKKHISIVNEILNSDELDEQGTQEMYAMVDGKITKVGQASSTSYTPTGTTTGETTEVNELLDFDGSIQSSKIPPGTTDNKTMSSKKTTDDVVKATTQTGVWSGGGHYFKRYYQESIEELGEHDMSDVLGYEDTEFKNAKETIDYFEDEHDMGEGESIERAEAMGKTLGLDERGQQRLTEKERLKKLSEDKARKMIEVLLSNKSDSGDMFEKDLDIMDSKLKKIVKYYKNGKSKDELLSTINKYWGDE